MHNSRLSSLVAYSKAGILPIPWNTCLLSRDKGVSAVTIADSTGRVAAYASVLPYGDWSDSWEIVTEFGDKPGILAHLTEKLKDRSSVNANIGIKEVTKGRIVTTCGMLRYGSPENPDGTTSQRAQDPDANLQYLRDYLTIELWPEIKKERHQALIFATRLRRLRDVAKNATCQGRRDFRVAVSNGVLKLPEHDWRELLQLSKDRWPKAPQPVFLAELDLHDRLLRLEPVSPERVITVDIEHRDEPGRIYQYADFIRTDLPGVNIVSSYLDVKLTGEVNICRMILEARPDEDSHFDKRVKSALNTTAARKRFADPTMVTRFPRPFATRHWWTIG